MTVMSMHGQSIQYLKVFQIADNAKAATMSRTGLAVEKNHATAKFFSTANSSTIVHLRVSKKKE